MGRVCLQCRRNKTQVQFLAQEYPLEEGRATHFSMFVWKIPGTEELGGLHTPWGHKESDITEHAGTALKELRVKSTEMEKPNLISNKEVF